jgi:hypothetical protein
MNEKPTVRYAFAHACVAGDSADPHDGVWASCLLRLDTSKFPDWEPKHGEWIPGKVTHTILLSKENKSLGPWAGFRVICLFNEKEKEYIDGLIAKGEEGLEFVGFVEHVCKKVASNYTKV